MFADRADAGRRLADLIAPRLQATRARLYGLARGGVIVGRPLADRLRLRLEVLIACKVGAPSQPELAVGAVAEGGGEAWDDDLLRELALDGAWIVRATQASLEEVAERQRRYRVHPRTPAPDELAIVVDDGIATGSTVLAALRGLAKLGAARRAVAAPLAASEAIERLAPEAAWVEAFEVPGRFGAVGAHYARFETVTDDELMRAL